MKKLTSILFAALLTAAFAAGCSGGSSSSSTATRQTTAASATTVQATTTAATTAQPTTEQPTTIQPTTAQPTTAEPTTEEPTTEEVQSDEWKTLYIDFINSLDQDTVSGYALVYIDGDDIPELYINAISNISSSGKLCWINNNQVCNVQIWFGGLSYIEKENIFMSSGAFTGNCFDTVYTISGNQANEVAHGDYNILEEYEYYKWNDTDMSKSEYFAARDAVIDTNETVSPKNLSSYSEIYSEIMNY